MKRATASEIAAEIAEAIAVKRCRDFSPGDLYDFLFQFARARDAEQHGGDTDGMWQRLWQSRASGAALAGHIEGLASMRVRTGGTR